jgi:hypothetical protein
MYRLCAVAARAFVPDDATRTDARGDRARDRRSPECCAPLLARATYYVRVRYWYYSCGTWRDGHGRLPVRLVLHLQDVPGNPAEEGFQQILL